MNNNIIIKFHGMETKDKPEQLKDYLESLLRHAPSRSSCHFHVFKESHGYLCKLTVHSNIKTFSSHSKNETIYLALKTVLKEVKAQITYWKKKRSSMELTGVHSVTQLIKILDKEEEEEKNQKIKKKDESLNNQSPENLKVTENKKIQKAS